MVSIVSLWLPILLAGVFVFIASSLVHMVLPFHKGDYRKLPAEDETMEALRRLQIPPGDYMVPCGTGPGSMKDPKFAEKYRQGPVLMMTVFKPGPMDLRGQLVQWFAFCLLVGVFAAYVSGRALAPGAGYLPVFRFAGVTSFIAYSIAQWQNSIWYKRAWGTTLRITADGLVYALLTAGTFGWLWPR